MTTPTPTRPTSLSPDRAAPAGRRRRGLAPAVVSVVLVAVGVVGVVVGAASYQGGGAPELVVVQDVPADVRAELDVTWARFTERFGGRLDCLPDVSVVLVRDVEGGDARYLRSRALIEIEIPTTPARFRESLAHELGHHVEHTCREFAEVRAALHPRWGGPELPWDRGVVWEETPSERWAEGVVHVVNGERVRHVREMPIDVEVAELIAAWGRGEGVEP